MPKALEQVLKRQARKKGFSKKRARKYIYGILRKTGWKPSREKGLIGAIKRRQKRLTK